MRVRNLAITLLAAIFGAAALSLEKNLFFHVWNRDIHVGFWIACFGTLAWLGVGFMDWGYYNRLLLGAVRKATEIEDAHRNDPLFGMVNLITEESRRVGRFRIYARHKILFFYSFIAVVTLIFAALILLRFPRTQMEKAESSQAAQILNVRSDTCSVGDSDRKR